MDTIHKLISESNNEYNNRIKYIEKLLANNIELKEAIRMSKVWYCIKYKKCYYNIELYNYIINYDK
jgi:hypothetical protein